MPTVILKLEVDERQLCEYCFNRDSFYNKLSERVYSEFDGPAFVDVEIVSIDGQSTDDWVYER